MTKQMNVNELKSLMVLDGWTHEQNITINNEFDGMIEGIAEVVSHNPNVPFDIHFNEGFKYNSEKDELTTQKDDSLYGIWWFTPDGGMRVTFYLPKHIVAWIRENGGSKWIRERAEHEIDLKPKQMG